ncbi:type II secretion system GspH family protein [Streptococcus gallolyticus]|nr:type II secretion system GspH family protein [Streptococcus gallolyticus]MBY5040839.1 type II secretion system GspH family protein [Streptococcus gallolyticus]
MWHRKVQAFTLLESLITLTVISFLAVVLSGSVNSVFRQIEENIFFLEFEQVYKNSQMLSASSQQNIQLTIGAEEISNGYQSVNVPRTVKPIRQIILDFDKNGGNSSLAKIEFQTEKKVVSYQLYLGSGRYKKSKK